jgi:hypothetical protein
MQDFFRALQDHQLKQEYLIRLLNPVIRGWTYYHRHIETGRRPVSHSARQKSPEGREALTRPNPPHEGQKGRVLNGEIETRPVSSGLLYDVKECLHHATFASSASGIVSFPDGCNPARMTAEVC